jgi:CheY-like chemotaxis protein
MADSDETARPVLVVDDDDDFRLSLAESLEHEGYPVVQASNGDQALSWLRRGERPRLVLLDLWMPKMDGWQLRRALEEPPFRGLPVVVMSAAHAVDPGFLHVAAVLEKPFSLSQLLGLLENYPG